MMDSQKKFLPKLYPLNRDTRKTWFVEFTGTDGKKKKLYGKLNHLPTLQARLNEADRLLNSLNEGVAILPVTGGGSNQLITDLTEIFELRKANLKAKSISAYQTHFFTFAKWYRLQGCLTVDALQATKFLNFIMEKGQATTRNNYRRNLKSLFSDLQKFYPLRYTANPFAQVRKIAESPKTKEWFKPAQVLELSKAIPLANRQLFTAVQLMYHCFIRPNELRQLQPTAFCFVTNKIRISSTIAKTARTRFVPIPPELINDVQYIKKLPANYYLFTANGIPGKKLIGRDTLSKQHEKIMRALQYPTGYTFYSWKNTGAVKMLMMDAKPMRYISKCMGHHSLDMTDKYFESLGVDEMGEQIIFPVLHKKDTVETAAGVVPSN